MYNKKRERVYNSSEINTNEVNIMGDVLTAPELNHTTYDEDIYLFYVSVKRVSEYEDKIPIMVSDRVIDISEITVGSKVRVQGQLRSADKRFNNPNMPKAFVFTIQLEIVEGSEYAGAYLNDVVLSGYVCKQPSLRTTPINNRDVSDIVLAVNRKYDKSDYISCITWGRNARYSHDKLGKGSYIEIEGRVQSREFVKHFEDGTSELRHIYEVSVNKLSNTSED